MNDVTIRSEAAVNAHPEERRDQVAADLTVASCAGLGAVVALYAGAVALGADAGLASGLRWAVGVGTPICLVTALVASLRTKKALPRRLFAISGALALIAPLVEWLGVDPSTIGLGFGVTLISVATWWLRLRKRDVDSLPVEGSQDALPDRSAG